ncbi:MAG: hypothetical protein Pg6A_12980 [Termitinemataceae bacterium]|nr:MAG: hypothetical protein Pg6A_12980 [Termitinemataceae bacterium]
MKEKSAETLPAGWKRVKLGEVAELKYGYTTSAQDTGDARFIRITDISDNGTLIQTGQKYVDLCEKNKEYLLKPGDLLVARTGTYGKTLLFKEEIKAIFASYLIRIRFNCDIIPEYYWFFAQSGDYWKQARKLVSGSSQPQFNANVLKTIIFPLPPLSEQKRIVDIIQKKYEAIKKLNKLLKTQLAFTTALSPSFLRQAFRGDV